MVIHLANRPTMRPQRRAVVVLALMAVVMAVAVVVAVQ